MEGLHGIVVIDEVQRRPELFPILRVLADRQPRPAQFLILGSASPELLSQSSESLAGRIEVLEMGGFSISEVGSNQLEQLWLRGGFPLSYLAAGDRDSMIWRHQFIRSFFERDLLQFHPGVAPATMMRFAAMLAHYHAQIWNAAELARALGVNESTVRRHLDLMTGLFMIRQLPPWFENLGKRQVKAPKIYIRDSGLLHSLLGITNERDLEHHPKVGASWEGYAIEEALKALQPDDAYFWASHQGAEMDLVVFKGGRRIGIECKRVDAPTITPSMRIAMADLKLDEVRVVYPGTKRYPLAEGIEAVPLVDLVKPTGRKG
jgi:predicted AAA+ superfamily ATPase